MRVKILARAGGSEDKGKPVKWRRLREGKSAPRASPRRNLNHDRAFRDERRIERGRGLYDLQRGNTRQLCGIGAGLGRRRFSANGLFWQFRNERRIGIFDIVYRV